MTSIINTHNNFNWKMLPKNSAIYGGHTRDVFVIRAPNSNSWVAKLETCNTRERKMEKSMPYIEEMAYKICKLFNWNTIPKTKVVHELSYNKDTNKYFDLVNEYKLNNPNTPPHTFTFQAFVEGNNATEQPYNINLPSYQRAILLDMILGKMDAKGENTMIKQSTGEIFEIDNEYLGNSDYSSGILNKWSNVKNQSIPMGIIYDILNVRPEQLSTIQNKYTRKDEEMRQHWQKEAFYTVNVNPIEHTNETWNAIHSNLSTIQNILKNMINQKESITVENIQNEIEAFHQQQNQDLWLMC